MTTTSVAGPADGDGAANIGMASHGFELKLPPGWSPVRSNLLGTIRAFGRSLDPRFPVPEGIYAYQRTSSLDKFNPPYVLVAIKNVGKIPESYVRKLAASGQVQRELTAAFRGPLKNALPQGYRLISATFDTNLFAMRMEMEFQSELGLLHFAVASFLTEKGTLEVTGLTRPADYAAWAGTFDNIITSVRFSDWLQYQKHPIMKLSGGTSDWLYPIGGVAIVIVGGLLYIRWLRSRDYADY